MNLVQTSRASWGEAAWLHIDKLGAKHLLGRCVRAVEALNAPGVVRACNAPIYAGEGYADTDGAPFKAYFCPRCAAVKIQQLR